MEAFVFSGGGQGGSGDGYAGYGGMGGDQFSDFFETMFRQGQSRGGFEGSRDMHGEDRHARISVDLRDSYMGATRSISLHAPELTGDGHVVTRDRTLNVKIPQGIRDGQKIRLTGQGGPGIGTGKAGDLFLEVDLNAPDRWRIEEGDVYLELPVAPWEAALGASVKMPIPSGAVDLKIPAGSDRGSKLHLKGKGLPGAQPGDFYVVLDVHLPPADMDEAKALYEKMSQELAFDPRAGL